MPKNYDYMVCSKCGRQLRTTDFYKKKTGERYPLCKECLTAHLDNRKPETFLWILKEFDVPYIEDVWVQQANKAFMKNPAKFGSLSVIGTYLRMMAMNQYNKYTYASSDQLNSPLQKEGLKNRIENSQEREEELKRQFEAGEISEAEYKTLTLTNANNADNVRVDNVTSFYNDKDIVLDAVPAATNFYANAASQDLSNNINPALGQYIPSIDVDENTIKEELTEEDIKYLALKWGLMYKPSQWVQMEKEYNEYAGQFHLNVDRDKVLKNICKLSLKMNEALDIGDIKTYRDLASTYDMMRKSAKFTEVQKDEHERREIDSIGEIAAFVEREGGAIPGFEDPINYPKDVIDFVIKDMKNYTDTLIKQDLGLSDLIESYVKKLQEKKSNSVEDIMKTEFKTLDPFEQQQALEEAKAEEEHGFFIEDIEAEAAQLAKIGGN